MENSIAEWFNAVAAVFVAVLAIWGDFIREKLAPIQLELKLHNGEGIPTKLQGRDNDGKTIQVPAFYYHLKVVNKRPWRTPRNCRVLLKSITKRGPDGVFHPISFIIPLQFVWSPSESTPSLVSIHDEQVLDFGRIDAHNKKFIPVLYSYSGVFEGEVKGNEALRYQLQIVADGYVWGTMQTFEVAYDGEWDSSREAMQRHLKIREIT